MSKKNIADVITSFKELDYDTNFNVFEHIVSHSGMSLEEPIREVLSQKKDCKVKAIDGLVTLLLEEILLELFAEDNSEIRKRSKKPNKPSARGIVAQDQPYLTKKKGNMCLNTHKVNSTSNLLQRKQSPTADHNDFNKIYLKSMLTKRIDPKHVQFLKDLFKVQRCTIEECKCMNMRLQHHKELFHDWDSSYVETKGNKEQKFTGFDHVCRTNSAYTSLHQDRKKHKRNKFPQDESSSQAHIRYEDMEKVPVRIFRNRKDATTETNQYINNLTEIQTNFFTTEHYKNNLKEIQANYVDRFNWHKSKCSVRPNLNLEEIRRAVLDWMECAPIYNQCNDDTDVILEIFLRHLKRLKQDSNCTAKMLQKDIKHFIDNLIMWFPGDKREQSRFKQQLKDELYENLHKLIFTDVNKCSLCPSRMSSSEQCKHYGYVPLKSRNKYTALAGRSSETLSEISEPPSKIIHYHHKDYRNCPQNKYLQNDSMMGSYYENKQDSNFDHRTVGKHIPFVKDSVEISRYYKRLDTPKSKICEADSFEDKSDTKISSARNRCCGNRHYIESSDARSHRTSYKPNVDSNISSKYNMHNSSEIMDDYATNPPARSNKNINSYPYDNTHSIHKESLKYELKKRNHGTNKRTHNNDDSCKPECGNYELSRGRHEPCNTHVINQVRKKRSYKPDFRENIASALRKTRFTSTTTRDDGVTSKTYIPNSCGAYIKANTAAQSSTPRSVTPRSTSPPIVISPRRNIPQSRFSTPNASSTELLSSRFASPTRIISPSQSSKNICPSCYKAYSPMKTAEDPNVSTNKGQSVSFENSSTIIRTQSFGELDSKLSCRCSSDKIAELVMRKHLKPLRLNKIPNDIDEDIVIQKLITRIRPVIKSSARTRKNILKHYIFEFLETLPVRSCCKNSKIIQTYKIAEDLADELNACFYARENQTVNVVNKIELDKETEHDVKNVQNKMNQLHSKREGLIPDKSVNSIGINTIDAIYKEVVAQLNDEDIDKKDQVVMYISDTFLDYVDDIELGNMEVIENEVFDVLRDVGKLSPINASRLTKQITMKMSKMINNKNNLSNNAAPTVINSNECVYKTKSGTLIIVNKTGRAQSERKLKTAKSIDTKSVNRAMSCISKPKDYDKMELLCAVIDSWIGCLPIKVDNIEGPNYRENIIHDLALAVATRVKCIKNIKSEVSVEEYLCYEIKIWLLNILHISNIHYLDPLNKEIADLVKQLKEIYFPTPSLVKKRTSKMEKNKLNVLNILIEDMYEEFMALQEQDRDKIVKTVALKVINCKEQYNNKQDIKKYVINMFKYYIYKSNLKVIDSMYKECEHLVQTLDLKELVIQGNSSEVKEIIMMTAKQWLGDQTMYTNSAETERKSLEQCISKIAIEMSQFLMATFNEPLEKLLPEFVLLVKSDLQSSIEEFVDKNDDYMTIATLTLMRCVLTRIKKYIFNVNYLRKSAILKSSNNSNLSKPILKTETKSIRLDEICKAVERWSHNLKFKHSGQDTELLKKEILSKIMNKLDKYSAKSPTLEINKSLKDTFFKLLNELKQNYDIEIEDDDLKAPFTEILSKAIVLSPRSSTADSYIQRLEDTAASSIPKLVLPKEKADIDLLKITMAEQFIIDNFTADEALKAKCGRIVIEQLKKCADESVLDLGDVIHIQYCVHHNMCKIDAPTSKAQLQKEINVIRLKWTVSEWFDELPLKPVVSTKDALEREQMKFAVAKKLYEVIEGTSDREASISSESIKWIEKLPLETDDIDHNTMAKKLKDKLSFYINLEKKISVPLQSPLVYPLMSKSAGTSNNSKKSYVQSKASTLLERKSYTNNPIDVLYNIICKWTESLEIDKCSNEIEEMKNNITANLVLKISNLNDNSGIFNHNKAYEKSLRTLILDYINNIGIKKKEDMVNKLVSEIMKSKHILEVHKDKQVYMKKLDSTVTAFVSKAKSNTDNELMFEGLKEDIIDNFIEYTYHKNDKEGRQVFKQKVKDAAIELLLRSDVPDIDAKLQSEDIFRALEKIALPNCDAIKDEIGEIRMKHEILRWYKEVPHSSSDTMEELRRDQLVGVLAKRLNEIEANGYGSDTEKQMVAEITKHSNKIGIDHNATKLFTQLVKRLIKTEKDRKTLNPQTINEENRNSENSLGPFKREKSTENNIVSHTSNESNWVSMSPAKKDEVHNVDEENPRPKNRSGTQNSNRDKTNNDTKNLTDFNNTSQYKKTTGGKCKGECEGCKCKEAENIIDFDDNQDRQSLGNNKWNNKSMPSASRGKRSEEPKDSIDSNDNSLGSIGSNKLAQKPKNRSIKEAPQGNSTCCNTSENLLDCRDNSFQSLGFNKSVYKPNNKSTKGTPQSNHSPQLENPMNNQDNIFQPIGTNKSIDRRNKCTKGPCRSNRSQQPKVEKDFQSLDNNSGSIPAEDIPSGNWKSMVSNDERSMRIKQVQDQAPNIEESTWSTVDTDRILREEAKNKPRNYRDEHDSAVKWLNRTNASEASEGKWMSLDTSNKAQHTTPKVPNTPNRYATSNLHDCQEGINDRDHTISAGSATYDVPEYEEMARQVPFSSTWGPDDLKAARQQDQTSTKAITPRDTNEPGSLERSHPSSKIDNRSNKTENLPYHVSYPDSNDGHQSTPNKIPIRRNQNGKPDICLCNKDRSNCPLHFMNCQSK